MNANIYKNRNDFFNFNPLVSNALKPIKAKTKILKHSLKRKKSFFFVPFIKIRKDKQRNKKEIVKNKSDIEETSNTNRILYKNIITKRNNSISDHLSKNYNNINRYMNVKNEKEKIIFCSINRPKRNTRSRVISQDNISTKNYRNNSTNSMKYISKIFFLTQEQYMNFPTISSSNNNNNNLNDNYIYKYDYITNNLRVKFHGNLLFAKKIKDINLKQKELLSTQKRDILEIFLIIILIVQKIKKSILKIIIINIIRKKITILMKIR